MFWQPYRCTTPRLLASCGHRRYGSVLCKVGRPTGRRQTLQLFEHFPPPLVVPVGLVGVEPPTSGRRELLTRDDDF